MARTRVRQRQKRMLFRGHDHREIIAGGCYHGAVVDRDHVEPTWIRYKPRLVFGAVYDLDADINCGFVYDIANKYVTVFKDDYEILPFYGYSFVPLINGCVCLWGLTKDGYVYKYNVERDPSSPATATITQNKFGNSSCLYEYFNISTRILTITRTTYDYREGQRTAYYRQVGSSVSFNFDTEHLGGSSYCGTCTNTSLGEFAFYDATYITEDSSSGSTIRTVHESLKTFNGTSFSVIWSNTFSFDYWYWVLEHPNTELPVGSRGQSVHPIVYECGDYFVIPRQYYNPAVGGYRLSVLVSYQGGSFSEYFINGVGDYTAQLPVFMLYRNSTAYLYCASNLNAQTYRWGLYTSSGNFSSWTQVNLPDYVDVNFLTDGISDGYRGAMAESPYDFVRIVLNGAGDIPDIPSNGIRWDFYPTQNYISGSSQFPTYYWESINGRLTDNITTADMCLISPGISSIDFIYMSNLTFQQSNGNYAFIVDQNYSGLEPVAPDDYVYGGGN